VKLLSNESNVEKKMAVKKLNQREIRFWKKDADFTASLWVIGEYIVMIYTRERPFYLIEIHNSVLAHNTREVFKNLWKEIGGQKT
jgi:hypothetical protein